MDSKLAALIATMVIATTMLNSTGVSSTSDFESFKVKFGKSYATAEEEAYRYAVFVQNKQNIDSHNARNDQTYTKGINQFTDLTHEEFKSIYLGYKPAERKSAMVYDSETFVGDVNWVTKGKVQKVKDQGQCGSCWAFSAVAACESSDAVFKGTLGDFSEQQLVDCSGSYGNQGCNGGLMDSAFSYFKASGICTEQSYSYKGVDGSCKASSCTKDSYKITGYTDVSAGSTSGLKSACDKQPVAIAVDAEAWSSYSGGVFSNCGTSLDHGVLLAGYTSSYWLVKNSWGASWGESGYIRLASGNTCGLANAASTPNI